MKRWNKFISSLALDRRVDFEEGDIGLAGGVGPMMSHGWFGSIENVETLKDVNVDKRGS